MAVQVPVLVAIWSVLRMVFGSLIPALLAFFWQYRWFVLSTTLLIGAPIVDGLEYLDEFLTWLTQSLDQFFAAIEPGVKADLGGGYATVASGAALMNCVIALDVYGQMGVVLLGAFLAFGTWRFGKGIWTIVLNLLKGLGSLVKTRR